jgi:hypothetical protein
MADINGRVYAGGSPNFDETAQGPQAALQSGGLQQLLQQLLGGQRGGPVSPFGDQRGAMQQGAQNVPGGGQQVNFADLGPGDPNQYRTQPGQGGNPANALGANATLNQRILGGIYGLGPQGAAGANIYNAINPGGGDGLQNIGARSVLALNGGFNPNTIIAQALQQGQTPQQIMAQFSGQRGFENGEVSPEIIAQTQQAMQQAGMPMGGDTTTQQALLAGSGFEGMPQAQAQAIAKAQADKAAGTGAWANSGAAQQPQQGAQTGASMNPAPSPAPGTSAGPGGAPAGTLGSLGSPGGVSQNIANPNAPNYGLNVGAYLDPSMAFTMQQGMQQLGNTYGAQGNFLSGPAMKGALGYSQGLASQNWNNAANIANQQNQFALGANQFDQNFGLAQNNQNFNQGMANNQFGLAQNQQNFNQGMANNQFGLAQQGQNFGQNLANQQFGYQQQLNNQQIPWNQQMQMAQLGLQGTQGNQQVQNLLAMLQGQLAQSAGQAQGTGTIAGSNTLTNAIQQMLQNYMGGNIVNRVTSPTGP